MKLLLLALMVLARAADPPKSSRIGFPPEDSNDGFMATVDKWIQAIFQVSTVQDYQPVTSNEASKLMENACRSRAEALMRLGCLLAMNAGKWNSQLANHQTVQHLATHFTADRHLMDVLNAPCRVEDLNNSSGSVEKVKDYVCSKGIFGLLSEVIPESYSAKWSTDLVLLCQLIALKAATQSSMTLRALKIGLLVALEFPKSSLMTIVDWMAAVAAQYPGSKPEEYAALEIQAGYSASYLEQTLQAQDVQQFASKLTSDFGECVIPSDESSANFLRLLLTTQPLEAKAINMALQKASVGPIMQLTLQLSDCSGPWNIGFQDVREYSKIATDDNTTHFGILSWSTQFYADSKSEFWAESNRMASETSFNKLKFGVGGSGFNSDNVWRTLKFARPLWAISVNTLKGQRFQAFLQHFIASIQSESSQGAVAIAQAQSENQPEFSSSYERYLNAMEALQVTFSEDEKVLAKTEFQLLDLGVLEYICHKRMTHPLEWQWDDQANQLSLKLDKSPALRKAFVLLWRRGLMTKLHVSNDVKTESSPLRIVKLMAGDLILITITHEPSLYNKSLREPMAMLQRTFSVHPVIKSLHSKSGPSTTQSIATTKTTNLATPQARELVTINRVISTEPQGVELNAHKDDVALLRYVFFRYDITLIRVNEV